MTMEPIQPERRTYFLARSSRFAPSDCPTSVVAAVPKANPGIKLKDSACAASEFAASDTVPRVAMIEEVITKAPEMVKRSNITGRLTRNTSCKVSRLGRKLSCTEMRIGPERGRKHISSSVREPSVWEQVVERAAPATPRFAPQTLKVCPNRVTSCTS